MTKYVVVSAWKQDEILSIWDNEMVALEHAVQRAEYYGIPHKVRKVEIVFLDAEVPEPIPCQRCKQIACYCFKTDGSLGGVTDENG